MRDARLAFLAAVLAGSVGCTDTPHNNVLVFGTDTKFGLDVSASTASQGVPQVTVGYRRYEAAWMPLAVNDFNCISGGSCAVTTAKETRIDANGRPVTGPVLFQGQSTQQKPGVNGQPEITVTSRDAYSVLGSFGATFSGTAGAGAEASGGLAQYFATGIAAQKLAENRRVADTLKVESGEAAKGRAAAETAEAKNKDAEARLVEAETEKKIEERLAAQASASKSTSNVIFEKCGNPEEDAAAWKTFVAKAKAIGLSKLGARNLGRATTKDDVEAVFLRIPSDQKIITDNIETLCLTAPA